MTFRLTATTADAVALLAECLERANNSQWSAFAFSLSEKQKLNKKGGKQFQTMNSA